ncbi:MAG: GHKL domain-containing protein [Clostridia bacterium]|nr:GHKL domain-containing protein [Clostridia bacterium]
MGTVMDSVMFFAYAALLLIYGVLLSAAFTGMKLTLNNTLLLYPLVIVCGVSQMLVFFLLGEETTVRLYPLITHLPILLYLFFLCRKRAGSVIVSVTTAYLCCQPSRWVGEIAYILYPSRTLEYSVRIIALLIMALLILLYFAPRIMSMLTKQSKDGLLLGIIPIIYYILDYLLQIYAAFGSFSSRLMLSFMPLMLCLLYLIFAYVYYKTSLQKETVERREQLARLALEQHLKEMETLRRMERRVRFLRHDMRFLLTNLAVCVEQQDFSSAESLIREYSQKVEETEIKRYCDSITLNYLFSAFESSCEEGKVALSMTVELGELNVDEISFSSILSNALDNALNAQKELPEASRSIRVMLKSANGKILLSVKNPYATEPTFSPDGIPLSKMEGHGYGTQNIRYLCERLGGKCQFIAEGGVFTLRVVL